MLYLFIWWVLLLLIGFAALPLTQRFFRFLPDRGYAFSKPLGLLLVVYPFWLLASFGFLQNTFGAIALILILLAAVGWGLLRRDGRNETVIEWLRANWRYALVVEAVFTVSLFAFGYFRAYNPEITATEKPMEFMFLNSILNSQTFPPHDAWLSGYSISYYYLGYVIVAALAKLGGTPSGYAFNLGLTTIFALTATGAFGLVFNLVKGAKEPEVTANQPPRRQSEHQPRAPYVFGILAIFLLLIIGNFEGVFEATYNAGIGSRDMYVWLDLHGLEDVTPSGSFVPRDNWWWWRASRVLNDRNPGDGGHIEVIDEFPAFSFLLGDLHPHVLALPFGLLALAVALNLLRAPSAPILNLQSLINTFLNLRTLLTVIIVGALGMLNTWDIVTYGLIIAAAFAITQYRAFGKVTRGVVASSLAFLVLLFVGGYFFYLPFYLGFSSQARGIAPNIFNKTPLHQYLVMFGLFVFVVLSLIVVLLRERVTELRRIAWEAVEWAVPLLATPLLVALLGLVVLARSDELRGQVASLLNVGTPDVTGVLLQAYSRALVSNPWVFLLLVVLIASIVTLGRSRLISGANGSVDLTSMQTSMSFVLLIALVGLALTFGTEFLYIRDTFETRMNTVFKLYYQAWVLLAMASAFGAFYVWRSASRLGRVAWGTAFGVLFALSLVYPSLAIPGRTDNFQSKPDAAIPTLDGWRWVEFAYPDDYAAIEWVKANAPADAIILEASGPQYSFYNRVSVATGLPTVLGWGGHELQWRGNYDEAGPREQDIEQIFQSLDVREVRRLLEKYGIEYVIVGSLEREKYKLSQPMIDKFVKIGQLVFDQGSMRIYQIPGGG